jgi:Sulfotransferase domain
MTTVAVGRLPDFIIIGAAKSGTTSLFNWLCAQPEIAFPKMKEPDFFSLERVWRRGTGWYSSLFGNATSDQLSGEASTSYTELRHAATASRRMAGVVPDVRLIYTLRHPIDRLRSHYRHEVQRGRERGTLATAVASAHNEYVGSSLYFTCLQPYVRVFQRDQICVVRFEDLVHPEGTTWLAILDYLGLPPREKPLDVWNRTAEKPGISPSLAKLSDLGLIRSSIHLPRPARKLAKSLFTRRGQAYERRLERSHAPLPDGVERRIWNDIGHLEEWLGVTRPLWQRSDSITSQTS